MLDNNKHIATSFLTLASSGKISEAYSKFVGEGFRHHNPFFVGTAQALQAGLVDEIHMDIMPILFDDGLRPFDELDNQAIQLEKIQMVGLPVHTHIRFRIIK